MRRFVFILIAALVVYVAAFHLCMVIVRDNAEQSSSQLVEATCDNVARGFDRSLCKVECAAYSMMSGMFYYIDKDGATPEEEKMKGIHPEVLKNDGFIAIPKDQAELDSVAIYSSLEDFLAINERVFAAYFVLEPGSFKFVGPEGTAPLMRHGDTHKYNLCDRSNVLNTKSVLALKNGENPKWNYNIKSDIDSVRIMSFMVPFFDVKGRFLGAFGVDVNRVLVEELLSHNIICEGAHICIADSTGRTIVETPMVKGDSSDYTDYNLPMKNYPWTMHVRVPNSYVYQVPNQLRHWIGGISLIGMLGMLICSWFLYKGMQTTMRRRAMADHELRLAGDAQLSMLPPHHGEGEGYSIDANLIPAREAGGDLYEYGVKDGHFIFVVGDVSGKGMEAALFMTQVVSLFRNAVRYTNDPAQIMNEINEVLAHNNDSMMFCTLLIGGIDLKTHVMRFANAGHDKPVIIPPRADDASQPDFESAYFCQMKANRPVALVEGLPYANEEIQLQPGTRVIAYTDGITEAKSRTDQLFGEDKLLATVKKGEPLLKAVQQHAAGAEQSDDITLLEIQL